GPEQAVGLALDPGGEEQRVERARVASVAEGERPEAVLEERFVAPGLQHLAEERPGRDVVGRDLPAAELADQQVVAERAEVARRQREAPGRVQPGAVLEAAEQAAPRREGVDEPEARSGGDDRDRVELGERDVEVAADVLDVEGREAAGEVGVAESPAAVAVVVVAIVALVGATAPRAAAEGGIPAVVDVVEG